MLRACCYGACCYRACYLGSRRSDACCALQTKNILIAVGGKPIRVPIEGNEHCIVSDEILHLPSKPSKYAALGLVWQTG